MKRWTYHPDKQDPTQHHFTCGPLHALITLAPDAAGIERYTLLVRREDQRPTLTELWRARKRLLPPGADMLEFPLPEVELRHCRYLVENGYRPPNGSDPPEKQRIRWNPSTVGWSTR